MIRSKSLRFSERRTTVIATALLAWCLIPGARAQAPCDEALFIHSYPVHDADAYAGLFEAVEGYVAGLETERTWPFAEDSGRRYPTRDYCPVDSDDRLVRLFEATPDEIEQASMQTGTLTLVSRDLAATRQAAAELAAQAPRRSELQGRRSLHFVDTAGNEFIVWEYPGPPEN